MIDEADGTVYIVGQAAPTFAELVVTPPPRRIIKGEVVKVTTWRDWEQRIDIMRYDIRAYDGQMFSIEATFSDRVAIAATLYELVS
jgi:hypothetical protein